MDVTSPDQTMSRQRASIVDARQRDDERNERGGEQGGTGLRDARETPATRGRPQSARGGAERRAAPALRPVTGAASPGGAAWTPRRGALRRGQTGTLRG